MVEGIELHDRSGQLLSQLVVDFIGDELPFVIAGVQKVPEVAVFPRQCLFRTFAVGDVVEEAPNAAAIIVSNLAGSYQDVKHASVFSQNRYILADVEFSFGQTLKLLDDERQICFWVNSGEEAGEWRELITVVRWWRWLYFSSRAKLTEARPEVRHLFQRTAHLCRTWHLRGNSTFRISTRFVYKTVYKDAIYKTAHKKSVKLHPTRRHMRSGGGQAVA